MMRKKCLNILLCGMAICLLLALIGCSDDSATIKVPASAEVSVGEIFQLPEAEVIGGDSATVTIAVTDPDGEKVEVANGGFLAQKIGEYRAVYSVPRGESATVVIVCTASELPARAAVSDFSVADDHTVSFTAEDGVIYRLYVNDSYVKDIVPGEDIFSCIPAGGNTVAVTAAGDDDYAESPKSNAVTIEKKSPLAEIFVQNNGTIHFEQTDSETYVLRINGWDEGTVTDGQSISDLLRSGHNTISVAVEGGEGVWRSDDCEAVIVTVSHKINDLAIDLNGVVTFTQVYGFEYQLTIDGSEPITVQNGEDCSAYLNENLTDAGTYELSLHVSAADGSVILRDEDKTSNNYRLEKLGTVTDLAADEDLVLHFTPVSQGSEAVYRLYQGGSYLGDVQDGSDISEYFRDISDSASLTVQAAAATAGYWDGGMSQALVLTPFDGTLFETNTINAKVDESGIYTQHSALDGQVSESGSVYDYSVTGYKLTASTEGTVFRYKDPVPFSGNLFSFATTNFDSEQNVFLIYVNLIDANDSSKVFSISYYLNQDSVNSNGVYVGHVQQYDTVLELRFPRNGND